MARPRKEAGKLARRVCVSIDDELYQRAISHKINLSREFQRAITERIGQYDRIKLEEAREKYHQDGLKLQALEAKAAARMRALDDFRSFLPILLKDCQKAGDLQSQEVAMWRAIDKMMSDKSDTGYALADMLKHLPAPELIAVCNEAKAAVGWGKIKEAGY